MLPALLWRMAGSPDNLGGCLRNLLSFFCPVLFRMWAWGNIRSSVVPCDSEEVSASISLSVQEGGYLTISSFPFRILTKFYYRGGRQKSTAFIQLSFWLHLAPFPTLQTGVVLPLHLCPSGFQVQTLIWPSHSTSELKQKQRGSTPSCRWGTWDSKRSSDLCLRWKWKRSLPSSHAPPTFS